MHLDQKVQTDRQANEIEYVILSSTEHFYEVKKKMFE